MEAEVIALAEPAADVPWIVTLQMDAASQEWFDTLRREHYPAELNRIAAHLTLFHKLPQTAEVRAAVERVAGRAGFGMRVTGVRSLGRGVAFGVESAELMAVQRELAGEFRELLTAQDRQGFRPHVVVQNKVSAERARALKERLELEFRAFEVRAAGLELWRYLGGPWELAERIPFH